MGFAFLLVTVLALAVRASILKDAYFITDDYMLSARAVENPLSWGYLTRVHTGHFEPIGFAVMWVLAHAAPLHWGWTVVAMLAGQLVLSVMVWRLLVELFGSRPLTLAPYVVFAFTPLTLPAFTWLAAAIIWLPLMIAIAGALRWHVRYVRTGGWRPAAGAIAWFVVGLASFEKIAVYIPFAIAYTLAVSPATQWRLRSLWHLIRRTWIVWVGYAVAGVVYLAIYIPGYRSLGNATPLTAPQGSTLWDFAFLSVFRTLIPATFGGPWSWLQISYGLGVVNSPRAFDWLCWLAAMAIVVGSLLVRRRSVRFWAALAIYLLGSMATVAVGRVSYGGSFVALETRYLADAAIPLVLALGACLMPLRGEDRPWTAIGQRRAETTPRRTGMIALGIGCLVVVGLSFNSMNGFANIAAANPTRSFVATTRASLATAPADVQIFDTEMPDPVMEMLFGDYRMVNRYLSPLIGVERAAEIRARRTYATPHILDRSGALVPMAVQTYATGASHQGCWVVTKSRVTVPLTGKMFQWPWAVRLGYLSSQEFTGTVTLGDASQEVTFAEGLGEVYLRLDTAGDKLKVTGIPSGADFCVGDVQVGTPVPAG